MLRSFISRRGPRPLHRIPINSPRFYSTPTPEYKPPTTQEPNLHRAFYQSWGIPIVKVFLGALLTYQVIYFGWLNLEDLENRTSKDEELKILEGRLAELTPSKPES